MLVLGNQDTLRYSCPVYDTITQLI